MGTKNAACDFDSISAESGFEAFNQLFGASWWRGFAKAGAASLARVSIEGKLGDDQGLSADIEQRPIHFALVIAKDTQVDDFLDQGLYLGLAITLPHTKQYQ